MNTAADAHTRVRTRRRSTDAKASQAQAKTTDRDSIATELRPVTMWTSVDELTPNPRNARTHTDKQISQIAASIREFGFTNPVLIDADGVIIAGHGRVAAVRLLGLEQVPTIRLDHLSEDQKRAYVIADNRLAELAGWDEYLLAIELQYLTEIDLDYAVEITGFETAEVDLIIGSAETADSDPADELPKVREGQPAATKPGDLWWLGKHRILCADARNPECLERLMDGARARMVFTDPPYNVPIDGHVCGLGNVKHRDFAMASGEMSLSEFTDFLTQTLSNLAHCCVEGALLYACMDWRHLYELLAAGRATDLQLLNLCVWNKSNGGMGSLYRSKHELVAVFKMGSAPHINNVALGRYGRYRSNVWDYEGVNTLRQGRIQDLEMHPTVKPAALVVDAIKDCTKRGHIVLDAFAGSGTTIIAAERCGRIGYALELDPTYVDVAVERWQRLTGKTAVHGETRLTFEETRIERENDRPGGEIAIPGESRKPGAIRVRRRTRPAGLPQAGARGGRR